MGKDKYLVHPFPADIIRGILHIRHHRQPFQGFADCIPVGEYQSSKFCAVLLLRVLYDFGNIPFIREQENGILFLPAVKLPDHCLPGHTHSKAEDKMNTGGQINRHATDQFPQLDGEHIQDDNRQHEPSLPEGLEKLRGNGSPQHIMHGIE